MFKLKLVMSNDEINQFENNRIESFGYQKKFDNVEETPYYDAIINGDMLAFNCLEDEKVIGGILINLEENNLYIDKLFVLPEEREKGAGTFMLKYIENNKYYFEDYYGLNIKRITLEPLETAVDFYHENGYISSGFQMYKKY